TARSRSAGSIFLGMTYILPTQKDAASNLGRFKAHYATLNREPQPAKERQKT
ncbi:hypothetical protein IWX81_002472, partial [Salinibacterium sp. CAN_S4]